MRCLMRSPTNQRRMEIQQHYLRRNSVISQRIYFSKALLIASEKMFPSHNSPGYCQQRIRNVDIFMRIDVVLIKRNKFKIKIRFTFKTHFAGVINCLHLYLASLSSLTTVFLNEEMQTVCSLLFVSF